MDESSAPGATPPTTRRGFHATSVAGGLWLGLQLLGHAPPARAQSGGSLLSGLAGISNTDASAGVKAALEKDEIAWSRYNSYLKILEGDDEHYRIDSYDEDRKASDETRK